MYQEEQLNAGILLKALYEKYVTGNNGYTIHPTWWDISDISMLHAFIVLVDHSIQLTELGADKLTALFSPSRQVAVEQLVNQLYEDSKQILNLFMEDFK